MKAIDKLEPFGTEINNRDEIGNDHAIINELENDNVILADVGTTCTLPLNRVGIDIILGSPIAERHDRIVNFVSTNRKGTPTSRIRRRNNSHIPLINNDLLEKDDFEKLGKPKTRRYSFGSYCDEPSFQNDFKKCSEPDFLVCDAEKQLQRLLGETTIGGESFQTCPMDVTHFSNVNLATNLRGNNDSSTESNQNEDFHSNNYVFEENNPNLSFESCNSTAQDRVVDDTVQVLNDVNTIPIQAEMVVDTLTSKMFLVSNQISDSVESEDDNKTGCQEFLEHSSNADVAVSDPLTIMSKHLSPMRESHGLIAVGNNDDDLLALLGITEETFNATLSPLELAIPALARTVAVRVEENTDAMPELPIISAAQTIRDANTSVSPNNFAASGDGGSESILCSENEDLAHRDSYGTTESCNAEAKNHCAFMPAMPLQQSQCLTPESNKSKSMQPQKILTLTPESNRAELLEKKPLNSAEISAEDELLALSGNAATGPVDMILSPSPLRPEVAVKELQSHERNQKLDQTVPPTPDESFMKIRLHNEVDNEASGDLFAAAKAVHSDHLDENDLSSTLAIKGDFATGTALNASNAKTECSKMEKAGGSKMYPDPANESLVDGERELLALLGSSAVEIGRLSQNSRSLESNLVELTSPGMLLATIDSPTTKLEVLDIHPPFATHTVVSGHSEAKSCSNVLESAELGGTKDTTKAVDNAVANCMKIASQVESRSDCQPVSLRTVFEGMLDVDSQSHDENPAVGNCSVPNGGALNSDENQVATPEANSVNILHGTSSSESQLDLAHESIYSRESNTIGIDSVLVPSLRELQVELPPTLDNRSKRSDTVSLSSASSTISHGSTFRGVSSSSGRVSPSLGDDGIHRRGGSIVDPRPPLFPKRGRDASGSQQHSTNSVSKLSNPDCLEGGDEMTDRSESRWIRQPIAKMFDPKRSIFASGNKKSHDNASLSTLGSAPEPHYGDLDDEDCTSEDAQSFDHNIAVLAQREASCWDMISDIRTIPVVDSSDESHAIELCSLSQVATAELGSASVTSIASDIGKASMHDAVGDKLNVADSPRRLRGMVRVLSASSRGSGRQGSRRRLGLHHNNIISIPGVHSEGVSCHGSPAGDDESGSGSFGIRSTSYFTGGQNRRLLESPLHKSQSSPNFASNGAENTSPQLFLRNTIGTETQCEKGTSTELAKATRPPANQHGMSPMSRSKRRSIAGTTPPLLLFRQLEENGNELSIPIPAHCVTMLEEELVAFSSLRRLEIPFRYKSNVHSLKYIGYVCWRQMVANWKHAEMIRAMIMRCTSPHFSYTNNDDDGGGSVLSFSQVSSNFDVIPNGIAGKLMLHGCSFGSSYVCPATKSLGGFGHQQGDLAVSSVSRFLAVIGSSSHHDFGKPLKHQLPTSAATLSVEALVEACKSTKEVFTDLVKDVVAFSLMNCCSDKENDDAGIRFYVNLKREKDIERKAKRKYGNDIAQVKDIMRAKIIFPDESSLVCGLLRLMELCDRDLLPITSDSNTNIVQGLKIARVKNLLSSPALLGCLTPTPLPTGYRHVLVNIRLANGMLAEIQFNLASLYEVLGEDGISLHREIVDLQFVSDDSKPSSRIDVDELVHVTVEGTRTCIANDSMFTSLCAVPLDNPSDNSASTAKTEMVQSVHEGENNNDDQSHRDAHDEARKRDGVENECQDSSITASMKDDGLIPTTAGDGSTEFECDGSVPTDLPKEALLSADFDNQEIANTDGNKVDPGRRPIDQAHEKRMLSKSGLGEHSYTKEDRLHSLENIKSHLDKLSRGDVVLAILEYGANEVSSSSRDIARLYCMHGLLSYIAKKEKTDLQKMGFGVKSDADLHHYAIKCLLRCLNISNQAISTGMTGWLEYGCSSPLDRLTQRPFSVLRLIAYDYLRQDNLGDAECVLSALVLQCEQNLPLYHPTTLTALLDLAIVSSLMENDDFSGRIVMRVAKRVSFYLSEMEGNYLSHLAGSRSHGNQGNASIRIEDGRDSIFMLNAFAALFQKELNRDIISLVKQDHAVVLIHHCFVADAFAVLANCVTAARSAFGAASGSGSEYGTGLWRLAYAHYERAFTGSVSTMGIGHASVSRAAYGMARCMREFEETETALEFLSLVVSAASESIPNLQDVGASHSSQDAIFSSVSFLPHLSTTFSSSILMASDARANALLSSALCLWLMAIFSLDCAPNEYGRERAFNYLHAASVSLQSALESVSLSVDGESLKITIVGFLGMIEDEAMQISEPLDE